MGNIDYQICVRCVMDTTDVEIQFDDEGVCNHCKGALQRMQSQPAAGAERRAEFERLVEKVKQEGKGKPYDCIIGVSAGLDSTMVAHEVVKSGLRPLAVHLDNGWNSELAVDNIRKTIEGLGIDLHTHVINWNEFKDLQLCFLKASIANCEAPTDHAITALLFKMASTYNVKYILSGSNLVTEAIMPYSWGIIIRICACFARFTGGLGRGSGALIQPSVCCSIFITCLSKASDKCLSSTTLSMTETGQRQFCRKNWAGVIMEANIMNRSGHVSFKDIISLRNLATTSVARICLR